MSKSMCDFDIRSLGLASPSLLRGPSLKNHSLGSDLFPLARFLQRLRKQDWEGRARVGFAVTADYQQSECNPLLTKQHLYTVSRTSSGSASPQVYQHKVLNSRHAAVSVFFSETYQDPTMSSSSITVGRILISLSAVANAVGPYAADWSKTHVFNPKWPPHAKFHNGQTMSMGLCLGLLTTYYTWSPSFAPQESLTTAAILGSVYWLTGLSAIFYPGSKGVDPEYGEGFPQFPIFSGFFAITWVGWWLESGNLAAR